MNDSSPSPPKQGWFRRAARWAVAGAILALAGLLACAVIAWLRGEDHSPPPDPRLTWPTRYRNVKPDVQYVGDAVCAECHGTEAAPYRHHPMGRSLAPLPAALASQPPGGSFEAEGFRYSVERQGGQVVHRQTCPGPDGKPLLDLALPVHYVIGSGERAHSYLLERDGFLYQSPITWYAQTKKWGLSPGYLGRRVGFSRGVRHDCLFCHTTFAEPVPDTINRYEQPIFHGHAIGCERCHGPGQLHVARHRDGADGEGPDDTIVNPARLPHELRESVCEQCHLQGAARVVRRGRGLYDFRPGLPLRLFWSVFVRPPELGGRQFVGHVEQMRLAGCYQKSAGEKKMGCVSCHDPHSAPAPQNKAAFYRGRCQACHENHGCSLPLPERKKTAPPDNCVSCHMPTHASEDIAHTTTTDHRVVRRPDKRNTRAPLRLRPGESPLAPFHAGEEGPEARRDLGLALVQLARQHEGARQQLSDVALGLLDEAVKHGPEDVPAWEARGQALHHLGRHEEALACAEKALALAPNRQQALADAADRADALRRPRLSLDYWGRAAEVSPWSSHYRFRRAMLWSEAGDWPRALAECEAVLRFDPANVDVRLLRVEWHLRQGDKQKARAELDEVLALHPKRPEEVKRWFRQKAR